MSAPVLLSSWHVNLIIQGSWCLSQIARSRSRPNKPPAKASSDADKWRANVINSIVCGQPVDFNYRWSCSRRLKRSPNHKCNKVWAYHEQLYGGLFEIEILIYIHWLDKCGLHIYCTWEISCIHFFVNRTKKSQSRCDPIGRPIISPIKSTSSYCLLLALSSQLGAGTVTSAIQ